MAKPGGGGANTQLNAGLAEMRKAIKELRSGIATIDKQKTKSNKADAVRAATEKKDRDNAHKTELKKIQSESKEKDKAFNKQMKANESLQKKVDRFEKQGDRQRKKELTHVKDVNREMSRGPLGRAGSFLGRTAAFATGGLMGLVIGAALRGYQDYTATQQALGASIGLGGRGLRGIAGKAGGGKGGNLGFNIMERAQLMPQMGRATGSLGPRPLMEGMRATGMDAGEVANVFAAIRGGGTKFNGPATVFGGQNDKNINQKGQGTKEFSKIIAAGMYSGLEKARLPDFVENITALMRSQQAASGNAVGGGEFAKIAGFLGHAGGTGWQGAAGNAKMAKLHNMFINPGGGEAGKAFMLQSQGFGVPGGGTGQYEAEKHLEEGLNDPSNMKKFISELTRQYGTGQDAVWKGQETSGLNKSAMEGLLKIYSSTEDVSKQTEQMQKIMDEAKPLDQKAQESMVSAGTNLQHMANLFDQSEILGAKSKGFIEFIENKLLELTKCVIDFLPKIWDGIKLLTRSAIETYNNSPVSGMFGDMPMPELLWSDEERAAGQYTGKKGTKKFKQSTFFGADRTNISAGQVRGQAARGSNALGDSADTEYSKRIEELKEWNRQLAGEGYRPEGVAMKANLEEIAKLEVQKADYAHAANQGKIQYKKNFMEFGTPFAPTMSTLQPYTTPAKEVSVKVFMKGSASYNNSNTKSESKVGSDPPVE